MKPVVDLMFESQMLKRIPRSGYAFLGVGRESVAEHTFVCTFIAYVMARLVPDTDTERLVGMCLLHDLAEARTGDMNYVQKRYVATDENRALSDAFGSIPFGEEWQALIDEFNQCRSLEARLAHDADQLALMLDLKALADCGHPPPELWLKNVERRLQTDVGRRLGETVMKTHKDDWWLKLMIDT
ncbi:MAG: HD domain-containing protein [Desulfobacteraceae bacterium]|jgi:putative hydrolase of HD superfamily|nr:HD domain-containing protein [Desulfobacteraceae bacterium]